MSNHPIALGGLAQLVIVVAVLGVCWWLFDRYVPLPPPVKTIITVVLAVLVILYLLSWIGIF